MILGNSLQKVKRSSNIRKIIFLTIILWVLTYTPVATADQAASSIQFKQIVNQPSIESNDLWQSLYEGLNDDIMPDYYETYDSNIRKWNSVGEIYHGLLISEIMGNDSPSLPSLIYLIQSTNMKNILINKLFDWRSDYKDVWWNDF